MLANVARGQRHAFGDRSLEAGIVDGAGAMRVGIDGYRLGNTDGIGDLYGAALGQAGGDDILGEITRGIGRRTVDLRRVLAGEGATAMRRGTAIGVDDDLAAGQSGVAVRAANHEVAGRIDQQVFLADHPAVRKHVGDQRCHELANVGLGRGFGMLCRENHLVGARRLAVIAIYKCDLAFGVRPQNGVGIRLSDFGKALQDLVRIMDCGRHQHIGLAAGIAEHQALVAGALVLVVATVDTHRDVGGLLVQVILEFEMGVMELVLLIADIGNGAADRALDGIHDARHLVLGGAHFTADDHTVGGGEGLAGNTGFRLLGKEQVEDGVRHPVAQLVRMSFGHRFRGKEVRH